MLNIISKKCTHENCKTRARFGYPLQLPTKCSQHKLEDMIKNPRARCLKHKCANFAQYGLQKAIHCSFHKNSNDLDLVERKCVRCGKLDVVNDNGICINFCLLNDEGYKIYQKRKKHKEMRIVNLLTSKFGKPTYQDQVIESNITLARPDIVYELKDRVIAIEIDENRHNNSTYSCVDENKGQLDRMLDIHTCFEGKNVFFVRYNPDSYKIKDKTIKTEQVKREELLVKWLEFLFSKDVKLPELGVLYLYYDEFDCNSRKYFEIMIKDKTIVQNTF